MFARAKRTRPHARRLAVGVIPPPNWAQARAPERASAGFVGAEAPEADADALIAAFRVRAFSEARRRQRQARARQDAVHWSFVASIIARRTADERGGEEPLRRAADADLSSQRETLAARPANPFPEVGVLEELERVLNARPQRFRLQFFAVAVDRGPTVIAETVIDAPDASSAIRAAADEPWPARAIGLRILDPEGREIFEQLRADRR